MSCAKTRCCENKSNPIAATVINTFFVTIPSMSSKNGFIGRLAAPGTWCSLRFALPTVYLKTAVGKRCRQGAATKWLALDRCVDQIGLSTYQGETRPRIRRIQQNLSRRDLARSMDHRRKFAC
jgi:hypothetical protein